jgi:hypothetical protein
MTSPVFFGAVGTRRFDQIVVDVIQGGIDLVPGDPETWEPGAWGRSEQFDFVLDLMSQYSKDQRRAINHCGIGLCYVKSLFVTLTSHPPLRSSPCFPFFERPFAVFFFFFFLFLLCLLIFFFQSTSPSDPFFFGCPGRIP